nr:LON peptidase substrate-binding domain-containing protein [Pseudorhodoferax sp. Leaf267]
MTRPPLPLFPLSTVLYPGGLLPLRIFEVRYLDMIGQCHRNGTPFGVVALQQGREVRRAGAAVEKFHAVGTLARIVQYEATQPGLLTIACEGAQRFRIQDHRQLPHGLWTADTELLPGDQAVAIPEDLQHVGDALEHLLQGFAEQGLPEAQWPVAKPWQRDDCGWLANRWCELLPLPLPLKQQMMELDNPLVRLELVGDLLAQHSIDGTAG